MNPLQWIEHHLNFNSVELHVTNREGSYAGLSQEALLTSPADYLRIFQALPQVRKFVDLGSGYGTGPLIYSSLYPDAESIGVEFEFARWEASLRLKNELKVANAHFYHHDLSNCDIPVADLYFLYFPTGPVLDRMLDNLGRSDSLFLLIVIESHGDLFARLDREDWLVIDHLIPIDSSRHSPVARIYRKDKIKQHASFHDYSFYDRFLFMTRDDGKVWLGDTFGMTWLQQDRFNLDCPPATIRQESVIDVLEWKDLDEKLQLLVQLRRLGHLDFINGTIRKIFIKPFLEIELSTGEIIKCEESFLKNLVTIYSKRLKSDIYQGSL